ncbi:DUF4157 domain-containing protein [Streptomyces sp. SBT349]|uniref:eCIS core domain-containing protein n=1 Tax=Streptomyces sp. SBT349 TaxID=1580539 RepID=UPI00066AC78E|nr:DUF4157 domain-containing protein [Streptomyces sp. SBT349]
MQADRRRREAEQSRTGPDRSPRVEGVTAAHGAAMETAGLAGRTPPEAALALQRAIGNEAFTRLMARRQAGEDAGRAGGEAVQRSGEDAAVQRDAMTRVDAVTRRPGAPMREDVRRRMENDYGGEDFGDVRVHTDRGSAEAVGAVAYTTKTNHIVFRSAADMDDHTMRHELQHVRQQRAGRVPQGVSHPADALEREAESTATGLTHGPAGGGRSTTAEDDGPAARPTGAGAGAGAVQRMLVTPRELNESWAQLNGVTEVLGVRQGVWLQGGLRDLESAGNSYASAQDAAQALTTAGFTKESMPRTAPAGRGGAGRGTGRGTGRGGRGRGGRGRGGAPPALAAPVASPEQPDMHPVIEDLLSKWRDRTKPGGWDEHITLPEVKELSFDIPGLGKGVIARIDSPEVSKRGDMLSWFSHGYEKADERIDVASEREYAFAVPEGKGLERVGAESVWESLPVAFGEKSKETPMPTTKAPAEYVFAHSTDEMKTALNYIDVVGRNSDVAILLSFEWAPEEELDAKHAKAREADTPPLPDLIEGTSLKSYRSLLIFACRTPWSPSAAVTGGKGFEPPTEVHRV